MLEVAKAVRRLGQILQLGSSFFLAYFLIYGLRWWAAGGPITGEWWILVSVVGAVAALAGGWHVAAALAKNARPYLTRTALGVVGGVGSLPLWAYPSIGISYALSVGALLWIVGSVVTGLAEIIRQILKKDTSVTTEERGAWGGHRVLTGFLTAAVLMVNNHVWTGSVASKVVVQLQCPAPYERALVVRRNLGLQLSSVTLWRERPPWYAPHLQPAVWGVTTADPPMVLWSYPELRALPLCIVPEFFDRQPFQTFHRLRAVLPENWRPTEKWKQDTAF